MASKDALEKLPKTMKVGPTKWEVLTDQTAAYDYFYLGVTLYRTRRLNIDPIQADTDLPLTFLHEVLHAIGFIYEIPEWQRHKEDDQGRITDKTHLQATAILQWLRDNPEVVKWLVETE